MNCFNHRTTPAVAVCRACGKGVCPACAHDTGNGVACRDSCETRVGILGRMVDDHAKNVGTANAQNWSSGILGVVMGGVFLTFAGLSYNAGQEFYAILFGGVGLPIALHGLIRLFREKYPNPES